MEKGVPFTKEQVGEWGRPTPLYIYDEQGIRGAARDLLEAFSWAQFHEHFAVKATPNPHILRLLAEEGFGADCSSMAELLIAEKAGITGERIMFSSNNTPAEEFVKAVSLGAIINLDDAAHLEFLEEAAGLPDTLCFRYNPGGERGNSIIGKPEESKFGMTKEQLVRSLKSAHAKGVRRLGVHCMTASNTREPDFFRLQAQMVFSLVVELERSGIHIEFVNFGGGVGIPYRPEDRRITFAQVSDAIRSAYEEIIVRNGLRLQIRMELGRAITGPHGYLVTRVRHIKRTYKTYAGVDACMANLMRPAMYGAYHHITVLGKGDDAATAGHATYDVVGSLCENNDKFAIDRGLPQLERGDILVIHDAGAHGYAMGFNYNGKLRCAEYLLLRDGSLQMIRRAETVEDYLATVAPLEEEQIEKRS